MATKAQKENQARFKAVQAEAKKLKAKNPKLAHTAAVKQAWAILYAKEGKTKKVAKKPARKAPAKKAVAKKKVGAVKTKAPIKRKVAPKKKVAAKSYHKDTQSHNVSVRVMSGLNKIKGSNDLILLNIKTGLKDCEYYLKEIRIYNDIIKMASSAFDRNEAKKRLVKIKKAYKETETHIKELKKLI